MNTHYLCHTQQRVVAVNDTDFNGQVKPGALMGYFQDIATEHAAMLGVGYDKMVAQGLGWVLIRMSYNVIRTPKLGETLTVKTFPEKPKASDVNRGYYIYDKQGDTVVAASSKWCVLELDTHKLRRVTPFFERFDEAAFNPNQPLENANIKLPALSDCNVLPEEPYGFYVQVTDLDQYMHMNNARYGDVILNVCGAEMLAQNSVVRADINFMAQMFIGDKYEVYKAQADNVTHIEARKPDERETVVFRARVEWRKR